MARRILVVEDEAPIREMVCFVLEQNGFQPVEAEDYDSAVNQLNEPWPDLILLDWMLPGGSGIQFIKHLKRESMTRDIPVVMLTARGEEEDRVRGLETGADDYITKPFSPKELMMRVKVVIDRNGGRDSASTNGHEIFQAEGLVIDFTGRTVTVDGKRAELSPKEYDLLFYLVRNRNIALEREKLITEVWGYDYYGDDRTLDTHIKLLRSSLGDYRKFLVTLRGVGYRFEA